MPEDPAPPKGAWIWTILWPAAAGVLLAENLGLDDLVERVESIEVPYGALMPRLAEMSAGSPR